MYNIPLCNTLCGQIKGIFGYTYLVLPCGPGVNFIIASNSRGSSSARFVYKSSNRNRLWE